MSEHRPNLLFGVSGSIAASQAPDMAAEFRHQGYEVKTVLTKSAEIFVTPTALAMRSRNKVYLPNQHLIDDWKPTHIELAKWADVAVLAPATAATIGKLACGIAQGLLAETFIALPNDVKKYLAPAMNCHMLDDPSVQRNLERLREDGYEIVKPRVGELACTDIGAGKIAAIDEIVNSMRKV